MSKSDNIKSFYDTLGINIPKKKDLANEKLFNLYEAPKKVKQWASVDKSNIEENAVQQCDLLFLPTDDTYKYCLVVCDVGGYRQTDAEPLKTKSSTEVLQAFQRIYKRKYIKFPTYMMSCDPGGEFKGIVKKYFEDQGVIMRYGKPDHHQSQASVEAKNHVIAKALFMRMTAQELQTGEKSTEWVEFLPLLIKELNKRLKRLTKTFTKFDAPILANKNNDDLLDEGTKVRVALDAPLDAADNSKLHGKFRATDIRWYKEPTKIKQILLRPDQPPMYLTEQFPHTPYLRERLQVVGEVENNPPENLQRKFIVEKLLEKKKIKNKIHYLVKWKGKPASENSYEPRTNLIQDIPEMVKAFDEKNK
jgi:hypothetical protein